MSRRGTAEQWVSRINDFRASGERVAAWCERNQVSPKQLYYWMAKLKKGDPQTQPIGRVRWVALSVEEATAGDAPPVLVKVGTIAVEVRAGFDPYKPFEEKAATKSHGGRDVPRVQCVAILLSSIKRLIRESALTMAVQSVDWQAINSGGVSSDEPKQVVAGTRRNIHVCKVPSGPAGP